MNRGIKDTNQGIKDINREIKIMGIVNLTDNSYFAQSRCLDGDGTADMDKTMGRIAALLDEGADIIDIGACSTRPGSDAVGAEEEWKRLGPVVEEMRRSFPGAVFSIDTYQISVVRKVYDTAGGFIVNDISTGEDDPEMLETVGKLGLEYIAMHKRGNPKTMQSLCEYGDVTQDIIGYFKEFAEKAEKYGIEDWVVDPGFGFAKSIEQNYRLLRELGEFKCLGREILVGVSRKSMIYRKFGITPEESLPQTCILHYAALKTELTYSAYTTSPKLSVP